MRLNKPDRVLAFRADRIIYQYAGQCAKVYSHNHACADILREAANLAAAGDAGINTPGFIEVTRVDGRWALVMDYVHGETFSELLITGKTDPDTCLKAIIKAQIEMHSADAGLFRGLKGEIGKRILQTSLGETVKACLTDTLERLENGNALCHGNLCPENVLVQDKNLERPFIIDWKQACCGSANADAAASWLSLELAYGRETARKYLQLYCAACGTDRRDIMRWVPVMAASRLPESVRRERKDLLGIISETLKDGGGCQK